MGDSWLVKRYNNAVYNGSVKYFSQIGLQSLGVE